MKTTWLVIVALLTCIAPARADLQGRDAGRHFQRGVDLYNDGDFRGALVEFKRAYALLPRAPVLYDIGQTEYQLQDYAHALVTLKRFLAETGPNTAHRPEVEATVEILRNRIGRVALTVDATDCEISVDERVEGKTPLAQPLTVSVGSRRVVVACAQRPPVVRVLEVAAGETVSVDLHIAPLPATVAGVPMPKVAAIAPPSRAELERRSRTRLALAWTSSALLLAGTIGLGAAALVESNHLDHLRDQFPVSTSALDQQAQKTRALSISTDVVGVAALAVVATSIFVTVRERRALKRLQFAVSPTGGASINGTF